MTKSIFEYDDYRKYLGDWIKEAKKNKQSNLSHLAKKAEIHTTYLSHILSGFKNLNLEQAALISNFIDHSKLEQDYFFILVQLERAGNPSWRDYLTEKKIEIQKQKDQLEKRFDKHRQLDDAQKAKFYSDWRFSAIMLSTDIKGGQTLEQTADRFSIRRPQAEEYLNFLVNAGLCKKAGDKYQMGSAHIHVPASSPFVKSHHFNWRIRALDSMNEKKMSDLFFTGPLVVSGKDYKIIRERFNIFISEMIEIAKKSESEQVVCFNLDLFHVTE